MTYNEIVALADEMSRVKEPVPKPVQYRSMPIIKRVSRMRSVDKVIIRGQPIETPLTLVEIWLHSKFMWNVSRMFVPKTTLKVIRLMPRIDRPWDDLGRIDTNMVKERIRSYRDMDIKDKREHICDLTVFILECLIMTNLKCPVCDEEILLKSGPRCRFVWSVDRIDNGKGHTQDNIRITCASCNLSNWAQDPDIRMARWVKHNKSCTGGCHKALTKSEMVTTGYMEKINTKNARLVWETPFADR